MATGRHVHHPSISKPVGLKKTRMMAAEQRSDDLCSRFDIITALKRQTGMLHKNVLNSNKKLELGVINFLVDFHVICAAFKFHQLLSYNMAEELCFVLIKN